MRFTLFLVLNFLIFVRPEDTSSSLSGLRIYLIVMALCAVSSYQQIIDVLTVDSLRNRPVTACVLIYFISTIVSLIINGRSFDAVIDFGTEFAKVIFYYLLLIVIVDTLEKFRIFIASLIVFIGILVVISIAQFHGITQFDGVIPYSQKVYAPDGTITSTILRLAGSGIFGDPNDVCLAIGIGIFCCLYFVSTSSSRISSAIFFALPVSIFAYALMETHSRGGLLGILAGIAAFLYAQFGGPRAIPLAVLGLIGILFLFGGRQTELSGGTAHHRLMMWAMGISDLLQQPFRIPFGLGRGWFGENTEHVAHNSFVQAYVEEGLFAGGAFLAAFVLGAWLLYRIGCDIPASDWVVQARPFAFATICGYSVGCYSLTRNQTITTYLAVGIAAVLIESTFTSLPEKYKLSGKWFLTFFLFAVCGLTFIKFATQGLGVLGV